jgi:hypothetical protein
LKFKNGNGQYKKKQKKNLFVKSAKKITASKLIAASKLNYGVKINYGVEINYGITALRHLRFTAFYCGITARAVTVKTIFAAPKVEP